MIHEMIRSTAPHSEKLIDAYLHAKNTVIAHGYQHELVWQQGVKFEEVLESDFLREYAWVVLASGMRDSVVSKKFPYISSVFFDWESAEKIVAHSKLCRLKALGIFGHEGKIRAILDTASIISEVGFTKIKYRIKTGGVKSIQNFKFMGPATSLHLGKNLGLDVAKPDRHLVRIANAAGYREPEWLCRDIAKYVNDIVPVIDLVLWRYATIDNKYASNFNYSYG